MNYFKLETSDGEIRWVNLNLISRVTLVQAPDASCPLLVITFADAHSEARVQIRGDTEQNGHAIRRLCDKLDSISDHAETLEVA